MWAKKEEMTTGWMELHREEPHKFVASPNTISIKKLQRIRWTGHLEPPETWKNGHNALGGNLEKKKGCSEHLISDGRMMITLIWILEKLECELNSSGSVDRSRCPALTNLLRIPYNAGNLFNSSPTWQLLNEDSGPWRYKVHYRVDDSPPLDPALALHSPVYY
jgi:hypothetical protein